VSQTEAQKSAQAARRASGGGKAAQDRASAKYRASAKGKAARARANARYQASPEGLAHRTRYAASTERKAARAKHRVTPVGKFQVFEINQRYNYGLSRDQYDTLVISQSGLCAGCALQLIECHTDHCHKTGAVRGLLCPGCNFAAGFLLDDPDRCDSLAEYLRNAA